MKAKHLYQQYLQDEFDRRRQRNVSYSLRAYARDLEVPPSKLSQQLRGLSGISGKKASLLAEKIRLSSAEIEIFVYSAEAAHARNRISRLRAKEHLQRLMQGTFSELNMEKFEVIRDWYHLAILELTEVSKFQADVAWVAKALGIPRSQVATAVRRLERVGLLNREDKRWTQSLKDLEVSSELESRAIQEFHHQMLNLVENKFDQVPLERRELGSMIFSIDPELLPEMKVLLRRYLKDAATLAVRSVRKDSLYTLNFQLMPLYEGVPG